jgi:hypothetical protein
MNTRIFLIFILALSLAGSCQNHGEDAIDVAPNYVPPDTITGHYIAQYLLTIDSITDLIFQPEELSASMPGNTDMRISLYLRGEIVRWANEQEAYDLLAARFNDYHFNEPMAFGVMPAFWVDTLTSITVTCNKEYLAGYPAGQPLDSLVTINYASAWKAINSSFERDSSNYIKAESLRKNLAVFNGNPYPLLGQGLFFDMQPSTLQESFDLTITAYKNEEIVFEKLVRVSYP